MDSTSLDQFAVDLQLDEEIRDEMSQYMQNNEDYRESNSNSIEKLMHKNEEEVNTVCNTTTTYEMSTLFSDAVHENHENQTIYENSEYLIDVEKSKLKLSLKINNYCQKIIQDMNSLGVCVIENFMEEIGELILQEVTHLYQTVVFCDGKVVDNNLSENFDNKYKIRGDSIHWVNGKEPNCKCISILMSTLDQIIFRCNKMTNNGLLGINSISSRTSAMVACYPGDGSRYMRHADNSIGDGRYITCIYYVNKNWEPFRDGGLLRIYPNQVAYQEPLNIVPEFDRLICFWSDRRNLHEVLPTKRLRFAITVWYFDDEERKRFKYNRNKFEIQ